MPSRLLVLLQLSDSAFPTGAFSHSQGLETLVADGTVYDEQTLEAAITEHLGALATSDLPSLRGAAEAGTLERVVALDGALAATRLAREARMASAATGRSLLDSATALAGEDTRLGAYREAVRAGASPGLHAVAYGVVARALGLSTSDALHAYGYGACAALVAAAQRLVPLGQRSAQRTLFRLHDRIAAAVELGSRLDPADPFSFSPVLEVAAMSHERQTTRLYIS